jgi:hypothetical protein
VHGLQASDGDGVALGDEVGADALRWTPPPALSRV